MTLPRPTHLRRPTVTIQQRQTTTPGPPPTRQQQHPTGSGDFRSAGRVDHDDDRVPDRSTIFLTTTTTVGRRDDFVVVTI